MSTINWLTPWYAIENATWAESQLRSELIAGHPLQGLNFQAIARREDCDDVLYKILDGTGRMVVVHLTYSISNNTGWPRFEMFNSIQDFIDNRMCIDHSDNDN